MKSLLTILALLLAAGLRAQPAPRSVSPAAGRFVFGPATTLAADRELLPLARYAAPYLGCRVEERRTADGAVVLLLDPTLDLPAEGYALDIAPERILLRAPSLGGVFNGLQQLFRLLPAEVYACRGLEAGTSVACCRIDDAPRFAYRGMMLDLARTWIDAPALKRYIDLLSYHNINKLHLHLSDDEGWRIEIRSHPELAAVGGFRGGDSPVRPVYGKWDEKYGGYFTQDEMRSLIDYAALRNIEIIPEIDLPGHSRCIASVRPEIRCNYPPDTVSTNGYDYRSAWCVAREENYALLDDILGELCALFPSEYIHVGGDEVETSQWERCPDCRALMRRRGLADAHALEDLFMERVAAILARHGKRPAVWNEAAKSGRLGREARVYGWESVRASLDATAKGYATVVMPGESFYFDMRQSPEEDGHDWAGIFDARKTYGFDPAGCGFTPEQMKHVIGLQGAFFSEAYISHDPERPDYLDYMTFPRICALARIAWSGNDEGWEAYRRELTDAHYDRMAAMGIRFRLFPPRLEVRDAMMHLSTDDGSELWQVADGGAPERYRGPVPAAEAPRMRFFSRRATARSPYVAGRSYYRTIAPEVAITTSMGESRRFPYANAERYRGLSRTTRACRQGDWVLYTFAQPVRCREMFLQTGNRQLPKTIVTTGRVEVSYDGRTFHPAGELRQGSATLHPDRAVRAVRIVSTCDDNGTPYVTIQPPRIKPAL